MKRIFEGSILMLMLLLATTIRAQDVEPLLRQFDAQPGAKTANQFFAELQNAEFLDEPIVFPATAPVDSLCQQVWYWAAEWFYDQQAYGPAEQYARQALPHYHGGNDERADCLSLLGLIYVRQGDIAQAAHYAKQCLEIDLRSGDDDRIASSMNTVAGIYMAGYQASEAEQYILGALEHINRVDNPARRAVILGMASEIYHTLGDDQKALPYAEEAYQTDSLLGRQPQMAVRLSQKGSALLGLHRYAEAESIYRKVIPQLKATGDYHSYAIALNRMGMALLCQERQREAIPYYKEAAQWFSRMGDLYNEIHAHRGLYESYWTLNPDSAKMELDRFDLLKDSLYKHSTADALSRYKAEFGNEQLQQENATMRQEHQRTVIVGIIVILFILLLAFLAIRQMRRRQQQRIQELVEEIRSLTPNSLNSLTPDPSPGGKKSSLTPSPSPGGEGSGYTQGEESTDNRTDDSGARLSTPLPSTGGAGGEAVEPVDASFLLRVIEVVNEGLSAGDYSVETIASNLNMSVSTFRRRLLSAAGESPKAYISAIQMERAATLLTDSRDMPIQQVARLCGFDETSTFGHTFKRIYGCSPSQYRERTV